MNESEQTLNPTFSQSESVQSAPDNEREVRLVKQWLGRIRERETECASDFERMRKDMRFARGLQWNGQEHLDDDRYVCNLVMRAINQGVALLYAKNPECDYVRRDRLDFKIWDGKTTSLLAAQARLQQAQQMGSLPSPLDVQLLEDYSQGELWRDVVERVGKTVRIIVQYFMDSHQPSFKVQMKQLVRRIKTTGVGYVLLDYVTEDANPLTTSELDTSVTNRVRRAKDISARVADGDLDENSPEIETARMLGNSIQQSVQNGAVQDLHQRVSFDFLPATSVIIDKRCRAIKGFIGAHWIAVRYEYSLEDINALFDTDIDADEIKEEIEAKQKFILTVDGKKDKKIKVYRVFDADTKSHFYVIDGYKKFLVAPEPLEPELSCFWPLAAVTFNDVEADIESLDEAEASIYPPSDVQLMRSPQKEWNRTREALRNHRIANTPCYMTGKGWLTKADKEKIRNHEDHAVIELEGAQLGTEINKMLAPFQHSAIMPQLYDTQPLNQDIQYSTGEQDANFGRPSPKVTATGATIAEQSRQNVAGSNIDDIDDFLSLLAQMAGEVVLRYFTPETAQRIAGRGAILPTMDRIDFLNEIMIQVKAASSGRPNKAMAVSNFMQVAPVLMQANANPVAIVEEGAKLLDDHIDVSKFFPVGPQMPANPMVDQMQAPMMGNQLPMAEPMQQLPNEVPVLDMQ